MRSLIRVVVLVLLGMGWRQQVWAADAADLRLVPFPKEVQLQPGTFDLRRPLVLEVPEPAGDVIAAQITQEFQRAGLPVPKVRKPPGRSSSGFVLCSERRRARSMIRVCGSGDRSERATCSWFGRTRSSAAEAERARRVLRRPDAVQLIRANRRGDALPCLRHQRLALAPLAVLPGRHDPRPQLEAGDAQVRGRLGGVL